MFWQWDYWTVRLMQLLYLTDGPIRSSNQPWNSSTNIPGHTEDSPWDFAKVQANGLTNSLGNASGSVGTAGSGSAANSFRGIENFFGSVWNWYDGFNINDYVPFVCFDPTNFADDTETNYTGIVDQFGNQVVLPGSDQYQKLLWAGTLLPSQVAGGADGSSYITDYYWQASGWRVARIGGRLDSGAQAGVASLSVSLNSSNANAFFGGRPAA